MKQLSGLDASFLYFETGRAPMHISGLSIYEPASTDEDCVDFETVLTNISERIRSIEVLHKKVRFVPLGLDHPYWSDDDDFDPEFHIRHVALPNPGDWRQLCTLIARLQSNPLNRMKPLWEIYVIEGLGNLQGVPRNAFALFTKIHHAAVDGSEGNQVVAAIHDTSPDHDLNVVDETSFRPSSDHSDARLLAKAAMNNMAQPFRFVSVARNTVPGFAKAYWRIKRGELSSVSDIPRTRFNQKVSPNRVFCGVSMELDDLRLIKRAVKGATINDVVICICGGALRQYLLEKSELPSESLAAMVPINIRSSEQEGAAGNVVSTMTVSVRSDIADPLERLRRIHSGTQSSKELNEAVGARAMTDYAQFLPSTLTAQAARLASSVGLTNMIKPVYNCVITNVPGPQTPLFFNNARQLVAFSSGPISDGLGLFHSIASYCGQIAISATSCRTMIPDPEFYEECLRNSFEELLASVSD